MPPLTSLSPMRIFYCMYVACVVRVMNACRHVYVSGVCAPVCADAAECIPIYPY